MPETEPTLQQQIIALHEPFSDSSFQTEEAATAVARWVEEREGRLYGLLESAITDRLLLGDGYAIVRDRFWPNGEPGWVAIRHTVIGGCYVYQWLSTAGQWSEAPFDSKQEERQERFFHRTLATALSAWEKAKANNA